MILTFRPIKVWPPGWPNENGEPSRFKAGNYRSTLTILERELNALGATDTILQLDASERDCRLDGQLRADAKVKYRGVILSFRTKLYGTLTYPCDAFSRWNMTEAWQANLRAIALGLEHLRAVERYGIAQRGQQYAGYAELPSGVAIGAAMTIEEAARLIAGHGDAERHFDSNVEALLEFSQPAVAYAEVLETLFRPAAKKLHPDSGGESSEFDRLVKARALLLGEIGR